MTSHSWIPVGRPHDIPAREGRMVVIGGREIAVFNLGDRFVASENRCPHRGGPLADGIVSGGSVVCPLHAWKIDVRTGAVERPREQARCVETYPVRVDGHILSVGLPTPSAVERDGAAA